MWRRLSHAFLVPLRVILNSASINEPQIRQFSNIPAWKHLIFENRTYYAGDWRPAKSGETFSVVNPATNQHLCIVPATSTSEAESSIDVASRSQKDWASKPVGDRANVMQKWANSLRQNIDALAQLITAENGKSLSDAHAEVLSGATALEWYAEEAKRSFGYVVPSNRGRYRQQLIIHQPVGVVGVITPWNFPLSMVTRKVGAALAAGCSVIIKPAEDTPLSALAITQLGLQEADIPPGVLNVLTATKTPEGAEAIGNVLCSHPSVHLIGFTGSTKVGKMLYQKAASYGKRVLLEMGGNAPFIVFDSADINKAVTGAIACKFRCSGQTCISANRIFVQSKIYEQFSTKFAEAASKLVIGDGSRQGVKLGPVINSIALAKVENLVTEALKDGAKPLLGAQGRLQSPQFANGFFYPTTVLINCQPSMRCMEQEIFGPVASLCRFDTEDEVIKLANDTSYGLAGYLYTTEIPQAWRVSELLQVGMVGINTGLVSTIELPFGGVKDSGMGREGGPHALLEFMNTKTLSWDVSP